jgi:hypothetical protein
MSGIRNDMSCKSPGLPKTGRDIKDLGVQLPPGRIPPLDNTHTKGQ